MESNTKSPEIKTVKDTQRKFWQFTYFWNEDTNQVDMIKRFEITFLKGCFGRETCPTTNRPHWQGFATARGKGYRFTQLCKQYPGIRGVLPMLTKSRTLPTVRKMVITINGDTPHPLS